MPDGATHGASHVTVKLAPVIVAGAMPSVKTAVTAEFVARPGVGPGLVVNGMVNTTPGRIRSGKGPVVNVHTNGLASPKPVVVLVAPLIVAV